MPIASLKPKPATAAREEARPPTPRRARARARRSARRIVRAVAEFIAIEVVGRLLYYSGALFLIGWLRQHVGPRRLLVPMYHRVRPVGQQASDVLIGVQRGISRDRFEQHVRVYRWFGPLLTLENALDHLHRIDRPRTAIALTFDDGYADNFSEALPVLRKHAAAATVFPVVRTASGGRPLWWDELSQIIRGARLHGDTDLEALAATVLDMAPPEDCDFAEAICRRLVPLAHAERDRRLELLAQGLGVERCAVDDAGLYASWDELRAMAAAGIEIGSHTIDHVVLSREEPQVVHGQLADSKTAIEQELRRPVCCLSYPNGGHDRTVHELAAAAGYRAAVTVEHGVNHTHTDPFQLRRVPVGQERPFHLALKLALYDFVHRA
jgi:peptidoglycan/xylan/chitin deacetylase (PgdA/CDA1 family)